VKEFFIPYTAYILFENSPSKATGAIIRRKDD
jgi:hypothetical protein